ncbi:AMP-binding protein [Streptomyces albidochromogenes]|uniref:AMP-binding protein n=1 Tax=Streptomyces albidochromogenes TaxID=329524 RepID=A0ABW6FJU1_9ACTN
MAHASGTSATSWTTPASPEPSCVSPPGWPTGALERGDVVAVALPNQVEALLCLFACWHIGAVVTPANPRLTAEELVRQLDDSQARLTVVDACAGPLLRSLEPSGTGNRRAVRRGPDTPRPPYCRRSVRAPESWRSLCTPAARPADSRVLSSPTATSPP